MKFEINKLDENVKSYNKPLDNKIIAYLTTRSKRKYETLSSTPNNNNENVEIRDIPESKIANNFGGV